MASVDVVVRTVDQSTSATRSMAESWARLATPLNQTIEIARRVTEGFKQVTQTIKDAAQVQATANTFDHLSASVGATADSMLSQLQPATKGMVNDLELMRASNQFLAMGLANTETEAAKLAQIGTTLGLAFRGDAAAGMEEWALLLANQSIPRLDTFGISAAAVRERIAELQQQTPGLSRETAFMTAVMEQADITLGKVGDQSVTAAGKLAQLETNIDNVKAAAKSAFAEGVTPLVDELFRLSSVVTETNTKARDSAQFWRGFFGIFTVGTSTLTGIIEQGREFGWTNMQLVDTANIASDATRRWIGQMRLYERGLDQATDAMQRMGDAHDQTYAPVRRVTEQIERTLEPMIGYRNSMTRMAEAHEQFEPAANAVTRSLETQAEAVTQLWQGFEKLNPSITSGFIEAMDLSDGKLTSFQEATQDADGFILNLATSMGATTDELSYLAIATGDFTQAQIDAAVKSIEFETRLEAIRQKFKDGEISVYQMRAQVRGLIDEMNGLHDKTVTVRVVTEYGQGVANNSTNSGTLSEFDNPVGGATGGLVRGGTIARDSVPALLMPGERVLTREENRQFEQGMMGGGGGMTFNIYLANPTVANARQIASMTAQEVGRRLGRG